MNKKKLDFYLDIKPSVKKFLLNLDKSIQERSFKKIYLLGKNPIPSDKKHILDINGNKLLCELSVDKLRFYYVINNGRILINQVEYLGEVVVEHGKSNHKSGNNNYPNQLKFIIWLKKWFRK